jgi:predicted CopG family antitoxin
MDKESFSDTILRVTKRSGKLADCFGTWKMTDQEEEAIQVQLKRGWQIIQERISDEMSRH